ncbi:MAG: glycosyltransferase family 4 protein [Pleurocapsa sp. MO_226.B13]|nr:glycosyltransferase family 4 protein [Pleurocapsa sp. MO_226.B13]
MNKDIKIACYGIAEKNAGSGVGAQFLILKELLQRGFQIDFYGRKNFHFPYELLEYNNFHPFYIKQPFLASVAESIQGASNILFVRYLKSKLLQQEIFDNHQNENYDLILCLQRRLLFKIEGVPVIAWETGPRQTNLEYIRKLRKKIISLCGIILYIKLEIFYTFLKAKAAKIECKNMDIVICGSQWSKDGFIEYGFEPKAVKVLPYPVDLNLFKLNTSRPNRKRSNSKVFLWLGRSEPRKRLDLLLDAYALLLEERQDVYLKVIGGFTWAPGYKKLIDRFKFSEYLEYQPSIDRAKVPELLEQCDVLIQPSEGENFGFSVAEALCCGLPVIVGPTNGTKDFISPSSFVFEDYTPESLKKTMLQAIESIEQAPEKLALDARETAEKNFNVSNIVDSLESLFQEAIELRSYEKD